MKKLVSTLFFVILCVSCGKKNKVIEKQASQEETSSQEAVIVGDIDWFGISRASREEKTAASPVGLLRIPSQYSRCTAFMITEDIAITNNHCIPDKYDVDGVKIVFNYTSKKSQRETYKCDEFLLTNKRLDYTLIKCQGKPGRKYGRVFFSNKDQFEKKMKVLVAHYNCDYHNDHYCNPYLKFSRGSVIQSNSRKGVLYYNADTLGGSSGSPVFYQSPKNGKYYLVALHNYGYGDDNEDGRGDYNSGNFATKILKDIKRRL